MFCRWVCFITWNYGHSWSFCTSHWSGPSGCATSAHRQHSYPTLITIVITVALLVLGVRGRYFVYSTLVQPAAQHSGGVVDHTQLPHTILSISRWCLTCWVAIKAGRPQYIYCYKTYVFALNSWQLRLVRPAKPEDRPKAVHVNTQKTAKRRRNTAYNLFKYVKNRA